MRATIARYSTYEQSPQGLHALIQDLRNEHGIVGAAEILGFSRSTISYWLRKLDIFRLFAGQSPDAILTILRGVAESQGIEHAASLIAVDVETLKRAFEKQDLENQELPQAS
jgi:hypothetical protein